jgi:hypothetical protein
LQALRYPALLRKSFPELAAVAIPASLPP